jgi:hypothetical protein
MLEAATPSALPSGTAESALSAPTFVEGPTTKLPDNSASGITGEDSGGTTTALITMTALGPIGVIGWNTGKP